MTAALHLAKQLTAQDSVTPSDADCRRIIALRLSAIGCDGTHLPCGPTHRDGKLYGRAASDMNASLAARDTQARS